MTRIDVLDWVVHTPWYFKFIRAIIGCGLAYGMSWGMSQFFGWGDQNIMK